METPKEKNYYTITNAIKYCLGKTKAFKSQNLPLDHPFRWYSRNRNQKMVERFLDKIAGSLRQKLSVNISLDVSVVSMSYSDNNNYYREEEQAVVQFRVFSEKLTVLLPFELVQDLNSIIQKKDFTPLYSCPKNEELTTLSYLLAEALTDRQLFNNHRVYLATVGVWSPKLLSGTDFEQKNDNEIKSAAISLDLSINSYQYRLTAFLLPAICERLLAYGELQPVSEWGKRILKRRICDCKLIYKLFLRSYLDLLQLIPGKRIILNFQQEDSGEEYLPLMMIQGETTFFLKLCKTDAIDKLICKLQRK